MSRITDIEKVTLAKFFNLEPRAVDAVMIVEASGSGFNLDGSIKIQFEPYWFEKYTRTKVLNGVELQPKEWAAFNEASALDPRNAIMATSWGLGQVMGFNYKAAGYDSPEAMVRDFKESEVCQLKGMLNFIRSNPVMFKALQDKDWATFAKHYNGPNYLQFHYDTRLITAYEQSKLPV